jgi:hypothetical protein
MKSFNRNARRVLWFAILPIWLPILIIALCTETYFLPSEWHVRRRMRTAGRWLPRQDLLRHLERQTGTLIVEYPTPGWRFSRLWWTNETLENQESLGVPEFERWCHQQYTDLDCGRAFLVGVWWGNWRVRRLERKYPTIKVVRYCSFFADLEWLKLQSQ